MNKSNGFIFCIDRRNAVRQRFGGFSKEHTLGFMGFMESLFDLNQDETLMSSLSRVVQIIHN